MAPILKVTFLTTRSAEERLKHSSMTFLTDIWIYFNLVGNNILLPMVVITFLFSKFAKRHPTLVNLCITWIFSGVFSLLLFYAKQHVGPDPNPSLCVAQASLVYGIIPMWAVAVLALVSYMLHTLRGESSSRWKLFQGFQMTFMLSAPYVAQFSFTIAALLIAFNNPEKVDRQHKVLYCSLRNRPLFLVMCIFTLVICVIIIALEVSLAVVIYRNYRTRRNAGLTPELPFPLIARVLLFGVYVAIGMCVNVLSIFGMTIPGDIFMATAGTVVFLIFGTQADVLRAWCFWRRSDNNNPPAIPTKPISIETRTHYTPSLDVIFRSARSETKFPWSDRASRTLSQPSTRRCSTKNFTRLQDDAEEMIYIERSSPTERATEEVQPTRSEPEMIELPRPARVRSRHWESIGEPPPVDGLARLDTTRRRRRDDPPRPKGPRKASISSVKTPSMSGSLVARPLAAARSFEFAATPLESSRTSGLTRLSEHHVMPL